MFNLPTQSNGRSRLESATLAGQTGGTGQSTAQHALEVTSSAAKAAVDKVGKCIADHPGISLGAAVTCGVIIGWFIKRNS